MHKVFLLVTPKEVEKCRIVCQDWNENIRLNIYHDTGDVIPLPSPGHTWWFNGYVLPNPRLRENFLHSFAQQNIKDQRELILNLRPDIPFLEYVDTDTFWQLMRSFMEGKDWAARHAEAALFVDMLGEHLGAFNNFLQSLDQEHEEPLEEHEALLDYGLEKGLIGARHQNAMNLCFLYLDKNHWVLRLLQAAEVMAYEGKFTIPNLEVQPDKYSVNLTYANATLSTLSGRGMIMVGGFSYANPHFSLLGAFTNFTDYPFMIPFASYQSLKHLLRVELEHLQGAFYMNGRQYLDYSFEKLRFYGKIAREIYSRSGDVEALRGYENIFVRVLQASGHRFVPLTRFGKYRDRLDEDRGNDDGLKELYFDQNPMAIFDAPPE